jgi:hypothetical protein
MEGQEIELQETARSHARLQDGSLTTIPIMPMFSAEQLDVGRQFQTTLVPLGQDGGSLSPRQGVVSNPSPQSAKERKPSTTLEGVPQ